MIKKETLLVYGVLFLVVAFFVMGQKHFQRKLEGEKRAVLVYEGQLKKRESAEKQRESAGKTSRTEETREAAAGEETGMGNDVQRAMEKLIKEGQVSPTFRLEEYNDARNKVSQLPEGEEKITYQKQLVLVQEVLDNLGVLYEK